MPALGSQRRGLPSSSSRGVQCECVGERGPQRNSAVERPSCSVVPQQKRLRRPGAPPLDPGGRGARGLSRGGRAGQGGVRATESLQACRARRTKRLCATHRHRLTRSSGTLVERFTNGDGVDGKTHERLLAVFRECRESARRHVSPPRSRNGFLKRSKRANETVARMSFDRPANETHPDRMDARFPCGPHEKLEPQTMDGHESRETGTRWAGTPRFS